MTSDIDNPWESDRVAKVGNFLRDSPTKGRRNRVKVGLRMEKKLFKKHPRDVNSPGYWKLKIPWNQGVWEQK